MQEQKNQNEPQAQHKKYSFKSREVSTPEETDSEKHLVYVVDDSSDDRLISAKALHASKYVDDIKAVNSADGLFQALKNDGIYHNGLVTGEDKVGVILLDIHMPGLSGIETLQSLRQHPLTCDIPIILLTNRASATNFYDAYQLKADGYLEKPLQLNQFNAVLKELEAGRQKMSVGY